MALKPVLLETSLRTVPYDILFFTLWTGVERNKLLVKLTSLVAVVLGRIINAVLLLLPNLLQWTLVVFALAHVDQFVIWRFGDLVLNCNAWHIHHGRIVEAAGWIEALAIVFELLFALHYNDQNIKYIIHNYSHSHFFVSLAFPQPKNRNPPTFFINEGSESSLENSSPLSIIFLLFLSSAILSES